uniref:Secreted protein n=1 Tax=Romanomermis culicivorax TaxID=13658 RepID=A0A915I372_ROMCU
MLHIHKSNYITIFLCTISIIAHANARGKNRPLKLRHLDKVIVKRIFQILNKEVITVENGANNKSGLSKKDLAILTALVSEPLKKLNPKFDGTSKEMLEKSAVLKRFDQAINNGVLAAPVEDTASEKQQGGLTASKIAHKLDHSMNDLALISNVNMLLCACKWITK